MSANKKKIQDILNKLWYGYIHHFDLRPKEHKLNFEVRLHHEQYIQFFEVEISQITSCLFSYDHFYGREREEKGEPDKWENMELTSIDYNPSQASAQVYSNWPNVENMSFKQNFNISIEIWSAIVLIKAKKIRINDKEFILE